MKEYIDREPIIKNLKETIINPQTAFINNVLIGLLKDAPVADVIEPVRCSKCIYSKERTKLLDSSISNDSVICTKYMTYKALNGYCDEGERK